MSSEQMYQEIILDYFRNPRNKGVIEGTHAHAHDVNTSCGDEMTITLAVDNDTITDAKFDGSGCAISLAAASMLAESLVGKTVKQAATMDKQEVLTMLNVPISGMRLKCALLGYKVMKMALVAREQHVSA